MLFRSLVIFVPMSLIGAALASMLPNALIAKMIKISVLVALAFLLINPKQALAQRASSVAAIIS